MKRLQRAAPLEAGQRDTGMKMRTLFDWILAALITLLAVADGLLHLMLDSILFHGRFWGSPTFGAPPAGPPGGGYSAPPPPPPSAPAPPHLPLPLNELFVLNCLGFIVLVIAFWLSHRWLTAWAWLVDLALIGMAAASIIGWFYFGEPNPQGLGYLSKIMEVLLIVLLLAHLRRLLRPAGGARA
jgi:hypothetical protein